MELTAIIADNILRLLEENNLSQSDLSSFLGISRQTLANYLKGTTTIDSVRLVKTAQYFQVPVDYLLQAAIPKSNPPMLLRAKLQSYNSIENIEKKVFDYIEHYERLCTSIGLSSCFFPEQRNLFIDLNGEKISINFDLSKRIPEKYNLDPQLQNDIWGIADDQRKLLGLNNSGAIELIPALINRGINVIFLDFLSTDVFGLSICDEKYGCYIFVNSNEEITFERQLFTLAHEYGHLILHRPLFSNELHAPVSSQYIDLLDKMADTFAGRMLCPPSIIFQYSQYYSLSDSTLKSIYLISIRLKKQLNVSLASLLLALNNYGLISKSVVNEYYRWARSNNMLKKEPASFKEDDVLGDLFQKRKTEYLIELLRQAYSLHRETNANEIAIILDCDYSKAKCILKQFCDEEANLDGFA